MHNSRFHSLAARLKPHGLRTSLRSRRSRSSSSSSSSSRTSSSDGEVERLVSPTSSTASRSTLNRAGSNMSSLFGIRLVPSEPEGEEEEAGPKELTNVLEPRPTDDMYFCSLEEKMQMRSF